MSFSLLYTFNLTQSVIGLHYLFVFLRLGSNDSFYFLLTYISIYVCVHIGRLAIQLISMSFGVGDVPQEMPQSQFIKSSSCTGVLCFDPSLGCVQHNYLKYPRMHNFMNIQITYLCPHNTLFLMVGCHLGTSFG